MNVSCNLQTLGVNLLLQVGDGEVQAKDSLFKGENDKKLAKL